MTRPPLPLRTSLLVGYGVSICLVLGVFGLVAAGLYWHTLLGDLDADLGARARGVARNIAVDEDGQFEILMPPDVRAFVVDQPDVYYVVRRADETAIDFTQPDLEVPSLTPPAARTRDGRREIAVEGNRGTVVVMGRSLATQEARYASFVRTLLLAGVSALVLALLSGWMLMRRALAPIERIGRTADAMSAQNLGLRIDVAGTESELGHVARALNGAFDRLQEAFERQTRFTADASHELRTPLTTILSEAEWATRRDRTPPEYRRAFDVCLRSAHRMRAVVDGLLALARGDAGRAALTVEAVDLAEVARDVIAGSASVAEARTVALDASLAPALTSGDRQRLREAIGNLVHNAIEYNHEHGRVQIVTACAGDRVMAEVRDSGIGIAADDLPHIFDRFYRADRTRSRAVGGSGLGLAIAKWIVVEHGGTIACESVPNEGSCFTITLPRRDTA